VVSSVLVGFLGISTCGTTNHCCKEVNQVISLAGRVGNDLGRLIEQLNACEQRLNLVTRLDPAKVLFRHDIRCPQSKRAETTLGIVASAKIQ
jgi:hypothetical protein